MTKLIFYLCAFDYSLCPFCGAERLEVNDGTSWEKTISKVVREEGKERGGRDMRARKRRRELRV